MVAPVESHGYTFVLNAHEIDVYDYERSNSPVAIIPVLDDNGHSRIHSQQDFEIEITYWLKDWVGV